MSFSLNPNGLFESFSTDARYSINSNQTSNKKNEQKNTGIERMLQAIIISPVNANHRIASFKSENSF